MSLAPTLFSAPISALISLSPAPATISAPALISLISATLSLATALMSALISTLISAPLLLKISRPCPNVSHPYPNFCANFSISVAPALIPALISTKTLSLAPAVIFAQASEYFWHLP